MAERQKTRRGPRPVTDDRPVRSAVRRAISPDGLVPPHGAVVVAVSGGPDSMALLHALAQAAPRAGVRLHVAHLNHGLRGSAADEDADYVAGQAAALGLPFTVRFAAIGAQRAATGGSLEALARRIRYQFLGRVALDAGADRVAVAHTADDQAETVLLRLVRGSGIAGLAGMAANAPLPYAPAGSNLRVVRPLLTATRAQVEAYCAAHGITPRHDPSNEELTFLRNRIRHQVLPLLRTLNPNVAAALNRLARHAAASEAALTALVDRAWPDTAHVEPGRVCFTVPALRQQPEAVQARLVRRALELVRGGPEDTDTAELDAVLGLLTAGGTRRLQLAGGAAAVLSYGDLWIGKQLDAPASGLCAGPPLGPPVTLTVPGAVDLPGWRVEARLAPAPPDTGLGPLTVWLDADRAGDRLTVRAWQPGDRIQPLGMTGHRKLQDLFTDDRVPAPCRDRIPVIEGPHGIAWVAGHALGQPYRVTADTRRVVVITAARRPGPAA